VKAVPAARGQDILIGPRTTVFALLETYPFLETFLRARDRGFEELAAPRAHSRWARVTALSDVALTANVTWRQLVSEIAAEVESRTGRPARIADAPRWIAGDDRRLGELRDIAAGLEAGAPLLEMAQRWRAATADLEPAEAAALDAALLETAAEERDAAVRQIQEAAAARSPFGPGAAPPDGHPLETLRREGARVRQLCAGLDAELRRLGGSPTRRRWQREKPLVSRLVDRLSGVESRFRRERQAWFPTLEAHVVSGPRSLLVGHQDEALEMLRRLRLAVDGDDAASVAEVGSRVVESLEDLVAQDERLLEPLALRYFSAVDWAAVRELEDGVGWRLIPPPPPWLG
jgi:DUF438 domain-containing protein